MGIKLLKLYGEVKARGGIAAAVKLAAKTRVTSVMAATVPDTAEIIATFLAAIKDNGL